MQLFLSTYTVVEGILSKSKHTLCGQTLQVKLFKPSPVVEKEVYELNQIKVRTSTTLEQDYFSIVVCSQLNMDEEDIALQMLNENSYLVTFQSAYSLNGVLIAGCVIYYKQSR